VSVRPLPASPPHAFATPVAQADVIDVRPGLVAAAVVFFVYGGLALSVDFPRAAFGFQSDEATYYMMAHSLAADGDLEYRRADLVRVWREFPSGPSGVFLKLGRTVRARVNAALPFLHVSYGPDPDKQRLYYGKSFMYPLVAAPFVWLFGTNGFLLLHALLLALVVLTGYLFLAARSPSTVALLLASGFFLASVTPGYLVWTTPELFNLVMVTLGYFCWLFKHVARGIAIRGFGWLQSGTSDLFAAVFLAIATFSKPSNGLLILPMLGALALGRRRNAAILIGLAFGVIVGGLFAINLGVTGDWNFQGGDRNTYYGAFPFQTPDAGFDVGLDRATNEVLTNIVFDPSVFWSRLGYNVFYFLAGRHSGMLPYFFPGVFALVAFLWPGRARTSWQWLVLTVAVAEILLILVWIPYNYFGGGGVLGNRYFMNTYGLFLFLIPPIESVGAALLPWAVGALFTAKIVLNPFYSSFYPAEHAKTGPLRWLPVEMTLINDLPINTRLDRVRVWFGPEGARFQIYFIDDNAFGREGNAFWVRGDSRADLIVKTADASTRLRLTCASGAAAAAVTVHAAGGTTSISLEPEQAGVVDLQLPRGFPYQGARAWYVTIRVRGGFVPLFSSGANDVRYLGVMVTPELVP
jgi:hypothetical protein